MRYASSDGTHDFPRLEVVSLFFSEPGELEDAVRIYREGGVKGLLGNG